MPAKKPALGRGLEALFGSAPAPVALASSPPPESALRSIPIEQIRPNPYQPRTDFDADKLGDLAASIREQGILQPILLRGSRGNYEIIAGERRWRAAQMAGLHEVPALIKEFDEKEMTVAAIIENVQRDDLNPIDEARGYETLAEKFDLTQETIAAAVGKSRVAITNAMRLLKLPPRLLDMVREYKISAGHARALLSVDDFDLQEKLADEILSQRLTVRDIEQRARTLGTPKKQPNSPQKASPLEETADLQEKLSLLLGLRVKILPKTNASGRVEVYYASLDEFQRFCDSLGFAIPQVL